VSISLDDVLAGARANAVPLTAECAGYLVLAAADQAVLAPRRTSAADLELSEEGVVRFARSRACEEADAERDLRSLLDELLLSASSVTPGLLRTGRRASSGSITTFLREIERALIPVNRAAARRALARLQRETARALESGKIPRERRADAARSPARVASPLPPSVEVALAAIPTPAPVPAAAEMSAPFELEPRSEPISARSSARALPPVLSIPSDPVPPPTPLPQAKLAPEAVAVLPSLTPPPATPVDAETRPEPVVLRASQRPPAAPATLPAPPPPRAEDVRPTTPVLGTVVAAHAEPVSNPGARDTLPAGPIVHMLDESFREPYDLTFLSDDIELVYLDEPERLGTSDLTEQCPPVSEAEDAPQLWSRREEDPIPTPLVLTERLALPIVPAVPRHHAAAPAISAEAVTPTAPASYEPAHATPAAPALSDSAEPAEAEAAGAISAPLVEPEPPFITEPEPSPIAELARVAFAEAAAELEVPVEIEAELISEVDFAVLVEDKSELPYFADAAADAAPLTPPPRHALPKRQQSDVSELIDRLGEAPLAVEELRTSLQHLAGVDLTPPPFRVRTND
jgi:hypothetical protein